MSNEDQTPTPPTDPLRKPMLIAKALVAILLIIYGVRCVRHGWYEPPAENAAGNKKRKRKHRGTDFTAFYSAGELARTGKNIFDYKASSTNYRPYLYPPLFAVFPMAPLSLLSHNLALGVFYALNVGLLLASLWMLRKMLWPDPQSPPETRLWRRPEVGLLLAVLVCGRFLDSNMVLGQANVIILFLLTLSLYWLNQRKEFIGGLGVALATTFKITPGLFGLYFLWSLRRWAMTGGALGLVVFLLIAPALLLGFSKNMEYLNTFYRAVSKSAPKSTTEQSDESTQPGTPLAQGERGEAQTGRNAQSVGWQNRAWKKDTPARGVGISLSGTFTKLLSPVVALDAQKDRTDRTVNILNFTPGQAKKIALALGLVLLIATALRTYPRWTQQPGFNLALSWGLVAQTMLLLSPLTRKAHCVVLLIPAAALIALLQQDQLHGAAKKFAWVGVLVLGATGTLTSKDVIGSNASEMAHAMGVFTLAMLVFFAMLMMVLSSRRPASGTEASSA